MSWLGSVMHIMHISFPKIRVTDTVLRVFGDHMMAHKRPSLSSYVGTLSNRWIRSPPSLRSNDMAHPTLPLRRVRETKTDRTKISLE